MCVWQRAGCFVHRWRQSEHLLCTYHLWKNFHQHIKPLFTGKGSQAHWRVVSKKWWAICKNSDERDCEKFSGSWKELTDYIDANATAGEDKASALQCVPSPSPSPISLLLFYYFIIFIIIIIILFSGKGARTRARRTAAPISARRRKPTREPRSFLFDLPPAPPFLNFLTSATPQLAQ